MKKQCRLELPRGSRCRERSLTHSSPGCSEAPWSWSQPGRRHKGLHSTQESPLQKEHFPSSPASVRAASVVGQRESRSLVESKCWVSSCTKVFLQKDLVEMCQGYAGCCWDPSAPEG